MSATNPKESVEKINLTEHLSEQISQLCLSDVYSDLYFIVENQKLPVHRYLLAIRNNYFRGLLYSGMVESFQKEIKLDVPLEPFKVLIRYIYSGQLCLSDVKEDIILETLILANNYGFTELEHAIVKYLKTILTLNNACVIFSVARACNLKDLTDVCYALMDQNASDLLGHTSFNNLSKELLEEILHRDSFLAPEFNIFLAVNEWCKHNSNEDIDSAMSHVRLILMSDDELLKIRQTGIVKLEKLMDAIEMRTTAKKIPYRLWPEENMAALKFGSKIIKGEWNDSNSHPNDMSTYNLEGSEICAIKCGHYGEIVVELGIISIINHIKILLSGQNDFSYFMEVSADQYNWNRVADYRDSLCTTWQLLYFPQKTVKFIKLVGTSEKGLAIHALKAIFTETMPKLINGFIAATVEICGTETEGGQQKKRPIFCTQYSSKREILRQLDQPYYVGSFRLFLCEEENYLQEYTIEISTNNQDWCTVVDKTNKAYSWQNISISPCPVAFVKIVGNQKSAPQISHYVHYEGIERAPSSADDL